MTDFYIGQRVVCVSNQGLGQTLKIGELYTIQNLNENYLSVEEIPSLICCFYRMRFKAIEPDMQEHD